MLYVVQRPLHFGKYRLFNFKFGIYRFYFFFGLALQTGRFGPEILFQRLILYFDLSPPVGQKTYALRWKLEFQEGRREKVVHDVLVERYQKAVFDACFQIWEELLFRAILEKAVSEVDEPQILGIHRFRVYLSVWRGRILVSIVIFYILFVFIQNRLKRIFDVFSGFLMFLGHLYVLLAIQLPERLLLLKILYLFKIDD